MSAPLATHEHNIAKAEPVPHAVPAPAAESNKHTESETEEDTDSEDYLDQIFAKVHDLLVLLRNSRAKEVARRRKRDRQLARARRRLRDLDSQIREALQSARTQ